MLQNVPIFARAGSDELLALAAIAKEIPFESDADLFAPGEPAAVHTVISGSLQLRRDGGPSVIAKSGDTMRASLSHAICPLMNRRRPLGTMSPSAPSATA